MIHGMRQLALAVALGGAFALSPGLAGPARAQVAPNAHWRTIRTQHFRVNYTTGLDSLARHAGAAAERAYARLVFDFSPPPSGTIDLVLSDNVDYSNGATTPFPYNHIYLYARPPVSEQELADFPDWMELLIDHELTHAFHLDRTSRVGGALRRVFGRVPMGWPFFPAVGTPGWNLEGMAVFYESHFTGQGRIYGSYHDMVLRTAALEGNFWTIDRLTGESPIWPGGSAAYIYGSYFLDWLAQRYGADVEKRIVNATAGQVLPAFGSVARKATGRSWDALYREWEAALRERYAPVAGAVRARGLTQPEVLTRGGYYALYPRVSPDSRSVAFAAQRPRTAGQTRVLDAASGKVRTISRRNSFDPAAWLPDGRLLTTQLDLTDPYSIFNDLWLQGPGGERRLTRGARLEQVDVGRDGHRAVAVQDSGGLTRVVAVDVGSGGVTPVTAFDARYNWAYPRWSPDGARIAVGRWTRGGDWDIVVLSPAGDVVAELTRDHARDTGPAWSPDGRWLLWESDRTGIPNIFAVRVPHPGGPVPEAARDRSENAANAATARTAADPVPVPVPPLQLMQVTNVLTGVAWPEISPDGKYVYFSGYHADGWHLERIGYDTAGWTTPAPAVPTSPDTIGVFRAVDTDTTSGPVTRYSPIATLLPRFWLPIGYTEARRDFTGIATAGVDAINRHSYGVQAAWDPQHREAGWSAGYEYAGLGNPVLQLSTSRSYDGALVRGPSGDTAHYFLVRRDDDASAALTFLRPRVRTAVSLTLGGDITLRHRALDDAPANIRPSNPRDRLAGVFAGLGFANYQAHPYSISREDGLAASAFARRRFSSGAPADLGYSEATSSLRLYRSLPLPGFAHHVLAGRVSGLWRGGPGAEPEDVGGASGQAVDLGLITAGSAGIFLPVRGYPEGERSGTRAWTASLEYRVPIALVGRGWGTRPYYLDRVSADGFVDAGNASCPDADARGVTPRGFVCSLPGARPLLGAGAELLADARILIPTTFRFRAGIGFPVSEGGKPRGWLTLGSSF